MSRAIRTECSARRAALARRKPSAIADATYHRGSNGRSLVESLFCRTLSPANKSRQEFHMSSVNQTAATIDDLHRVEGKAELIAGRIVFLMPTGFRPGKVGGRI